VLQDWLEVEKGLNNTALQLDLKRAWVAKAIRNFNNEAVIAIWTESMTCPKANLKMFLR
jgi:hypothetical protein